MHIWTLLRPLFKFLLYLLFTVQSIKTALVKKMSQRFGQHHHLNHFLSLILILLEIQKHKLKN